MVSGFADMAGWYGVGPSSLFPYSDARTEIAGSFRVVDSDTRRLVQLWQVGMELGYAVF